MPAEVKTEEVKAEEVKAEEVKRTYDSSRRRTQARAHRARVVEVARRRFLEDGYAATTLAAVAADADVSVETIYKAFRNKAGLLKAIFDVAVVGDDAPVALMDREWVAAISAEPDGREKLRMYAAELSTSLPRSAPIQLLIRGAAVVDSEIAAVADQLDAERLTGMTAFATHLHGGGYVRGPLTVDDARDILWTYNSVELYELLVMKRGWSIERYRDFVADALVAALLPD